MQLQRTVTQLSEYKEDWTDDRHVVWIDPCKCRHKNTTHKLAYLEFVVNLLSSPLQPHGILRHLQPTHGHATSIGSLQ